MPADFSQRNWILPAHARPNRSATVFADQRCAHTQHHLQIRPRVLPNKGCCAILPTPRMDNVPPAVLVARNVVDTTAEDHPAVRGRAVTLQFGIGHSHCRWCWLISTTLPGRNCSFWTCQLRRSANATSASHSGTVRRATAHASCVAAWFACSCCFVP